MTLILGNLLFFAIIAIVWLVVRGFRQLDIVDTLQKSNVKYQQDISGKLLEFREHLASLVGSGIYEDDPNLSLLLKHANHMIDFLEGLERGIKIEFLEDALEKPKIPDGEIAKTVAHFTSDRDEETN